MPSADMEALELELKQFIIDTLSLEDVGVDDIATDLTLFGEGLGLDSVDALELGVGLQKKYKVTIAAQSAETREHFATVKNLASFISANRSEA
tara:strand:+ start:362 stop:640 length:279 start_codon:yes stop_codon:yes gene_type:complete